MSRCEATHPWSGLQCTLEAPHPDVSHEPELLRPRDSTPEERQATLADIEGDLRRMVREWIAVRGHSQEAVAAQLMSTLILFCSDCGMTERVLLTSFIGMLAPDPVPADPSPAQIFSYVASVFFDLPIEPAGAREFELRINGKGIKPSDDAQPSPEPT